MTRKNRDKKKSGKLSNLSTKKAREMFATFKFAVPLAWKSHPRLCLGMIISSIIAAQASPLLVLLTGAAVNEVQPALEAGVQDDSKIVLWLAVGGAMGAVLAGMASLRKYTRNRLYDEIHLRVHETVLKHAASLDLETRENVETQNCIKRAMTNPGGVILNASFGLVNAIACMIQSAGLLAVLLWIEPLWSGMLVLLGIPHLFAQWYLSRNKYKLHYERTTSLRWSHYYSGLLSSNAQLPSIQTLRLTPYLIERFRGAVGSVLDSSTRIYRQQAIVDFLSSVITLIAVIGVVGVVGKSAIMGRVSTGEFVAFWVAAWRLQSSLSRLATAFSDVFGSHFDIVNLREFMDLRPTVRTGTIKFPESSLQKSRGRIECRNLTYTYPGAKHAAVSNVNLTIEPNEKVALVGSNGAGKSTLARMLVGLYQPTSGNVLIDGHSITDFELSELHKELAYLPQDMFRLEATAHENIAIGNIDDLLDHPEDVRKLADQTGIDGFLSNLPDGYETHLGRVFGETSLSGGQWRRLAVARTLASNPSIVILDEPFSNLDPNAEEKLYGTFEQMLEDRTSLMISHRFSMLANVDRIIVMEHGQIIEQGHHDSLMKLDGVYATLYRSSVARYQLSHQYGNKDAA